METPPIVEKIWGLIARQLVVQVDAALESDGAVLTIHLSDDSAVATFVHLPPKIRTEMGARKVADWVHQGLIADTFGVEE